MFIVKQSAVLFFTTCLALSCAFGSLTGAEEPKPDTPNRGGAGGKAKGGSGGDGGAGGSGGVITLPDLTEEQMKAIERTLTPEEKKAFDKYVELSATLYARQAGKNQPVMDVAALRKMQLSYAAYSSPKEPAAYLRQVISPQALQALHKQVDPLYVSPAERAGTAQLPAGVAADVEGVVSNDIETYLAARRKVLAHGPGCRALIADRARKLPDDSPLRFRFTEILNQFDTQEDAERIIRVTEAAIQRATEIGKARDAKAPAKIAVLVSRSITMDGLGGHPRTDPRGGMCYYSFPKEKHGYEGAVSLMYGNGRDDSLDVRMYGGQQNRLKDLGPVDFAGVKSAPDAKTTATWASQLGRGPQAIPEHVYIEHCLEPRDSVDMTVKFKVIDVKPGQWVVIEWEMIPQDK